MDSFFINAIGLELQSKITGAQIGKPWLGDAFRLIFPLSISGEKMYLYCSCDPSLPILYLTGQKPLFQEKGPEQTELLVRKYLTGAFITKVQVVEMDRILLFDLQRDSQHQDLPSEYPNMRLIIEVMGRHANVILISDQGKILMAMRYVPAYKNRYRQILLGSTYKLPPLRKIDPKTLDESTFHELQKSFDHTVPLEKYLHQKIRGLDLLITREICFRAQSKKQSSSEKNLIWEAFSEILLIYQHGTFTPRILYPLNETARLSSFHLEQYTHKLLPDLIFSSASEAARHFEKIQLEGNAVKSLRNVLLQKIRLSLEKTQSRESALEKDRQKADHAEEYRQKGDLIMANLYRIKKGMDRLETEDLYSSSKSASLSISLDPLLTPAQNAQRYYKKYTKIKKSLPAIRQRLKSSREEISFLSSLQSKIMKEDQLSILEKYQNLLKEKRIILPGKMPCSTPQTPDGKSLFKDIRRYVSVDGFEILVGRNDRGNDLLTTKIARKHDLWFHTQDVAGSHVLVRNPERIEHLPFSTIRQAASLAAHFSKARKDTKVMVDYTFAKYVTKPKGAKPGLVLVNQKKSILVSSHSD